MHDHNKTKTVCMIKILKKNVKYQCDNMLFVIRQKFFTWQNIERANENLNW